IKILVVAAHPDDEVLGCGGAIARLAQEGHDIHFAIVGEGVTSRGSSRDQTDPQQLSRLHSQARAAAECLRVKVVTLFGLTDDRLRRYVLPPRVGAVLWDVGRQRLLS